MRQGRSKRHHYVPKALQKFFKNDSGSIWYAKKNDEGRFSIVGERNPKSAFWEKNYNLTLLDGQPSDQLETGFWGDVDNHIGELITEIEGALDANTVPMFSGYSRDSLCNLFAALMLRSPDALPNYDPLEMGNEVATQTLNSAQNLSNSEMELLTSRVRKIQNGQHIIAMARVQQPTRVLESLRDYQVRFVRLNGRCSFILGSRIVHRIGNGGDTHLDNPETELWFPISPRTVVVLLRPRPETPHIVDFPQTEVRKFNEYVCRSCSSVGSHSYKLLSSLTRQSNP